MNYRHVPTPTATSPTARRRDQLHAWLQTQPAPVTVQQAIRSTGLYDHAADAWGTCHQDLRWLRWQQRTRADRRRPARWQAVP